MKKFFLYSSFALCAASLHAQQPLLTGRELFKKPAPLLPAPRDGHISSSMLVSPSFSTSNLPFFCRQELNIEHSIHIPFKFRLGSVQYVDYLERKPNAALPLR